jgi:hypothetical protein
MAQVIECLFSKHETQDCKKIIIIIKEPERLGTGGSRMGSLNVNQKHIKKGNVGMKKTWSIGKGNVGECINADIHRKGKGDVYDLYLTFGHGKENGVPVSHSNIFLFKRHRKVRQRARDAASRGKTPVSSLIPYHCGRASHDSYPSMTPGARSQVF